ncbi:MAG: hypothetical protein AB4042_04270 [Leptolyngbyaceae cyanobacterium]
MNAVASQKFQQFRSSLQGVWQQLGHSGIADAAPETATMVTSIGALLVLGTVGAGIYAVTRPCTMGGCPPLEQAERLSASTAPVLDATASMDSVSQTYTSLLEMNYQLEAVPLWSPYYHQAQSTLMGHEEQADVLAQLLAAQQQALDAAIASQSPPHPLATWQSIAADWQSAIAQLDAIATDDRVAPLVEVKLEEYQANLATVQQRIQREAEASQIVTAVREALHGVEVQGSGSYTLEHLKVAESTLQTALTQLAEVPADTMVAAEAAHLLAIYQPRLTVVSDRIQVEQQSTQLYTNAHQSAGQALVSIQTRQWSAAVTHWQEAMNHIQQIPEGTAYHDQVKSLLTSYEAALGQAQEQLDQVLTFEQAQRSLNETCASVAKVCQFVGPGTEPTASLRVQLTPHYDELVEQVMQPSGLKSSTGEQLATGESVNYLLRAIATVGKTNQVPIELYRSDGVWVSTYQPGLSGYTVTQAWSDRSTMNILSASTSH